MRGWGARRSRRGSGAAARVANAATDAPPSAAAAAAAAAAATATTATTATTSTTARAKGLAASYDGASVLRTESSRRARRGQRRVTFSAEDPFVNGNWSSHVEFNDSASDHGVGGGGGGGEGTVTHRINRIIKHGGDDDFILSPGASKRLSSLADTEEDDMENW